MDVGGIRSSMSYLLTSDGQVNPKDQQPVTLHVIDRKLMIDASYIEVDIKTFTIYLIKNIGKRHNERFYNSNGACIGRLFRSEEYQGDIHFNLQCNNAGELINSYYSRKNIVSMISYLLDACDD